jgi:hypothetical protein
VAFRSPPTVGGGGHCSHLSARLGNIHPLSPQKPLDNSNKFIHHGLMLGVAVVSITELCWPAEGYPNVVRPSGTMISPLSVVYDGVTKPGIITESILSYNDSASFHTSHETHIPCYVATPFEENLQYECQFLHIHGWLVLLP